MAAVLVGLWAPEDDHDALVVGVAVFVILFGVLFPLLWAAALHLDDLTFTSVAVPGQVIH